MVAGGLHFQNEKSVSGWCAACPWRGTGSQAWDEAQRHTSVTEHRTVVQTMRLTTIERSRAITYEP